MYKTIVLHADASRHAPARLQLAAQIARQQQAHLVCSAMTGLSRYLPQRAPAPDLAPLASAHAQQVLAAHAALAAAADLPSYESRLVQDEPFGGLVLQSRYADLLVLGQPDRDDPASGSLLQDLPQHVILHGCCPVLVVPFAGHFPSIGRTVLAAWDGSLHAARALHYALPLLRQAQRVVLAMVDPVIGADAHGEEPGADMALHLARHGVQVEAQTIASFGDVGEALLAAADSQLADLLVMGAYGHARWQELVLGGVTRSVLAAATLPVLMAH